MELLDPLFGRTGNERMIIDQRRSHMMILTHGADFRLCPPRWLIGDFTQLSLRRHLSPR
jgi:hypothetical protein